MNAKEAIAAALAGRPDEIPRLGRDPEKKYPPKRIRERVALTIDRDALQEAREIAMRLGFSLSEYVEAGMITGKASKALRERANVKSTTALDVAPIARLGTAAAGTVFAIKDAIKSGRPVDRDLLDLLNEISAACSEIMKTARARYDADMDERMRFKTDDRWGG